MLLPKFDYHEPVTLEEAFDVKARYLEDARLLAGGTDLIVHLKKGLAAPAHVISLGKIDRLAAITADDQTVSIGSCVTVTDLIASQVVGDVLPALAYAGQCLGSLLVRNRATIGGNVNSARPAADLIPSLMVYGAVLRLESSGGQRDVAIEEFITAPGVTVIRPDEIMTEIRVPRPPQRSGAAYLQLGKRKTQEINVVNVASSLCLGDDGTVLDTTIALGSVGPTPLRAPAAEAVLKGKTPSETLFFEAAEEARAKDCRPIDDFRGTADYRRAMIGVLVKRTLASSFQAASV